MGTWQGDDYRDVPIPDDPRDIDSDATIVRRAYLWRRINEEGHPSLIEPREEAQILGISRRQVYYDLEAVREFVSETVGSRHLAENVSVFEKAKREALSDSDWNAAVDILMKEAEWLADRGAIEEEPDRHELTWREYMEMASEDSDADPMDDAEL